MKEIAKATVELTRDLLIYLILPIVAINISLEIAYHYWSLTGVFTVMAIVFVLAYARAVYLYMKY